MRPVNLVLIALVLGGVIRPSHIAWAQATAPSGTVITIVGNGVAGFSIAIDRQRNTLYLPAVTLGRVRQLDSPAAAGNE